jgi:hypothetical protein
MSCFAVWLKSPNRQIRVYEYTFDNSSDRARAETLARNFADAQHANGYPCTVEHFGISGVGVLVYDTASKGKS